MAKFQKGYREYLLCQQCEQAFCAYERPFAAFWRDKVLSKAPFAVDQGFEVHGAEYHSTKMFLLSVFWRAAVSELFGQVVEFGPFAEKLRTILLENRRVPQSKYPLMGILILDDAGKPFHGCVTQPFKNRSDGLQEYAMQFGGCEWTLILSDEPLPKDIDLLQHVVGENGTIYLVTQHHSANRFLSMMGRRMRPDDQ